MPSSDAEIIQREQISQVQRWQLPPVRAFGQPVAAEEPPPAVEAGEELAVQDVRLPTAEEFQQMVARAEEEGRQRGHAAGLLAGREEGLQAASADIASFQRLVQELAEPIQRFSAGVEQALLTLSLEIAKQVIRQELQARPELLLPLVREALAAVPIGSGAPILRLHPQDCQLIAEQMPELAKAGVQCEADDTLERGSLIVQTGLDAATLRPDRRWQERSEASATELDLRLATRWRQVLDTLFAGVEA